MEFVLGPQYILEPRAGILDVMAPYAPDSAGLQNSLSHRCLSPFKVHPALSLQRFKETSRGSVCVISCFLWLKSERAL